MEASGSRELPHSREENATLTDIVNEPELPPHQ